jgi:hypothetical protein
VLWRSIHRSASTRTPQPNKRQSVGAGREARSGAITRQGSARQPIWAAWPPSARPAASPDACSHRCSSDLAVQANKRISEQTMLREHQNGASRDLVHGSAGMSSAGSRSPLATSRRLCVVRVHPLHYPLYSRVLHSGHRDWTLDAPVDVEGCAAYLCLSRGYYTSPPPTSRAGHAPQRPAAAPP